MKKVLLVVAALLLCSSARNADAQNIVIRVPSGGVIAANPRGVRIVVPRVAPVPNYNHYNRGFQGIAVNIGPTGLVTRFPNAGIANRYPNFGLARRR